MAYPYGGVNAVSLGTYSASTLQQSSCVAVGYSAGRSNQGANSIAIGSFAGDVNQAGSTIVLNATGSSLPGATSGAVYIAPMRYISSGNVIVYNSTTNEVSYSNTLSGGLTVSALNFSTLTGSTITTNTLTLNSTISVSSATTGLLNYSSLTGSTITGNTMTLNSTLLVSTATTGLLNYSSLTGSTITGNTMTLNSTLLVSTATTGLLNYSSLVGSTITGNTMTLNSTLTGSTITTRLLNYSSLVGSTITGNTMTLNSTLSISTATTGLLNYSSLVGSTITTNTITVNSSIFGSTMTTTGNVGIGTNAPRTSLHEYGSSVNKIPLLIHNANGSVGSSAAVHFGIWSGADTNPNATDSTGPSAEISAISQNASNANTDMAFSCYTGVAATPNFTLVERMRITAGGNVGIRTNNPTYPLTLSTATSTGGIVHTDGTITFGTYIGGGYGGWFGTFTNHNLNFFVNNGGPSVTLTTGGLLGIGLTNPSYQLDLSTDNARKLTTTTWLTGSDERLKTNIELADKMRCIEIMKTIPLKRYTWRQDIDRYQNVTDKSKLGWIAQDVEVIFPKAVDKKPLTYNQKFSTIINDDGTTENKLISEEIMEDCRSLDVDQIYAVMYGAIQQLITTTESLTNMVNSHTSTISSLQSTITSLISTPSS